MVGTSTKTGITSPEPPTSSAMPWFSRESKGFMLESWFLSVMADGELDTGQVKTAWALSFLFNSKTGKAWAGDQAIAYSINLKPETVRKAVRGLVKRGHLIKTREVINGQSIRVLRAAAAHQRDILRVGDLPPELRSMRGPGGGTSPSKVGEGIPLKAGEGRPHILREDPLKDPGHVQDEEPEDDHDQPAEPSDPFQGLSEEDGIAATPKPHPDQPEAVAMCATCHQRPGKFIVRGQRYCAEHAVRLIGG